jgi:hypothetical protein
VAPLQEELKKADLDRQTLIQRLDKLSSLQMQYTYREFKLYQDNLIGSIDELEEKVNLVKQLNGEFSKLADEEATLTEKKFNLLNTVRSFPLIEEYADGKADDSQYAIKLFKHKVIEIFILEINQAKK